MAAHLSTVKGLDADDGDDEGGGDLVGLLGPCQGGGMALPESHSVPDALRGDEQRPVAVPGLGFPGRRMVSSTSWRRLAWAAAACNSASGTCCCSASRLSRAGETAAPAVRVHRDRASQPSRIRRAAACGSGWTSERRSPPSGLPWRCRRSSPAAGEPPTGRMPLTMPMLTNT